MPNADTHVRKTRMQTLVTGEKTLHKSKFSIQIGLNYSAELNIFLKILSIEGVCGMLALIRTKSKITS